MDIKKSEDRPTPLPLKAKNASHADRFECSVRNFILRSACKVDNFFTIRDENGSNTEESEGKEQLFQELEDEDLESSLFESEHFQESFKSRVTEKHLIALPSVINCRSGNPSHKLHINCLVSPPLKDHEVKKLKFEDDLIKFIDK